MHFRIVLTDLCHKKTIKKNEHEKSDRFFIAFCNWLSYMGARDVKLSRVLEVAVKQEKGIYGHRAAIFPNK